MANLSEAIAAKADRLHRRLLRHRERYIKAWIAVTGLHPTECELVEERYPMGEDMVMRTRMYVRKRGGV